MEKIIVAISSIGFLAFILGLIKPKLVFMPNRKMSSLVYLAVFIGAAILGSILYPKPSSTAVPTREDDQSSLTKEKKEPEITKEKPFKYKELTLSKYKMEYKEDRTKIIKNYIEHKQLNPQDTDLFYNCISQISYTKSPDLNLNDTLGWCYADFMRDPKSLNDRVNLDIFMSNFSKFSGAYRPLEKLIKNNMDDDSSYKHDETDYRFVFDAKPPYAIVSTIFKGKNSYGAIVKENIKVKVDLATGDILEVIPQ
ncbi:hypothetical protein LPL65_12190 [Providencia huaxiensis]|uniref:hypothetical protein n=1 Tax=Providencia huaxiensis TaxID=2027290 RepID=UPI001E5EE6E3|nr:hypothetical protein [Providencia huaxiensis]MCD2528791.1 hypothetical protein [Providencia huaxiensis]